MPRAAARRAPRQALAARPPGRRAAVRCAAQQAAVGKEIAKTEIPAFVPRLDFITQLLRWAFQESQADGLANFGLPLRITPVYREPDELWGFNAAIIKDGRSATDISVGFDEESTTKYEWVGRGSDGFPIMEGNTDEILGKHLVIRYSLCCKSKSISASAAPSHHQFATGRPCQARP